MKSAPIYFSSIEEILLNKLKEKKYSKVFFLVDENTHVFCLPLLLSNLEDLPEYEIIEIASGEENKTIETVTNVWLTLSELSADRRSVLINLGGGVITDMGGFLASTFKRGIDFINIPTTLLSMVDASAGGKNGIDLEGMKNQIGTFTQPEIVLVNPLFLNSLEERQIKSGLAEMLKHGLIADKNHWENLINLDSISVESISPLIQASINIKRQIVDADPYETGTRKILNFGHTIGHAIESESLTTSSPLLHGEAIIIGMLIETMLSFKQEFITKTTVDEIFKNLSSIYTLAPLDENLIPRWIRWMKHDKKNKNSKINFSLLKQIGEATYDVFLDEEVIVEAFQNYNAKLKITNRL